MCVCLHWGAIQRSLSFCSETTTGLRVKLVGLGGCVPSRSLHGLDVMKRVRRGAEQYRFAFGRVDTAPGKSRVLVLQDNDVYT